MSLRASVSSDRSEQEARTSTTWLPIDYSSASRGGAEPAFSCAILLDAGTSLTIRDPLLESTPLGWACWWGRIEIVRLYLERGADPADAERWATPLAMAAMFRE